MDRGHCVRVPSLSLSHAATTAADCKMEIPSRPIPECQELRSPHQSYDRARSLTTANSDNCGLGFVPVRSKLKINPSTLLLKHRTKKGLERQFLKVWFH